MKSKIIGKFFFCVVFYYFGFSYLIVLVEKCEKKKLWKLFIKVKTSCLFRFMIKKYKKFYRDFLKNLNFKFYRFIDVGLILDNREFS